MILLYFFTNVLQYLPSISKENRPVQINDPRPVSTLHWSVTKVKNMGYVLYQVPENLSEDKKK